MTDRTGTTAAASAPDVENLVATLRRCEESAGAAGVRIGHGQVVHRPATHLWARTAAGVARPGGSPVRTSLPARDSHRYP
jgi:hypothetical protein